MMRERLEGNVCATITPYYAGVTGSSPVPPASQITWSGQVLWSERTFEAVVTHFCG
jgi:hypothetical protein